MGRKPKWQLEEERREREAEEQRARDDATVEALRTEGDPRVLRVIELLEQSRRELDDAEERHHQHIMEL